MDPSTSEIVLSVVARPLEYVDSGLERLSCLFAPSGRESLRAGAPFGRTGKQSVNVG
ncbi:hypothetical protein PPGU19_088820 (plasmid) [Paraburkholderia sp. PGU19]|nr:hypothetical protein PPGU19_088820 [Paraburkholderia sp. PGU19]